MILDSLEHALARGAKIYCEIAGAEAGNDTYNVLTPRGLGKKCHARYIKDAWLKPENRLHQLTVLNATVTEETKDIKCVRRAC